MPGFSGMRNNYDIKYINSNNFTPNSVDIEKRPTKLS